MHQSGQPLLLRQPGLAAGLAELVPLINQLGFYSKPGRDMVELYQVTWWLGELESYVDCIQAAGRTFRQIEGELHSKGLRRLRAYVEGVEGDDTFRHLVRELPDLLARMRDVLSVTVGINLDTELRPVEATLISVNDERFVEPPLLRLLFGSTGEYEGLMPLHSAHSGGGGSVHQLGGTGARRRPAHVPTRTGAQGGARLRRGRRL